MKINEKYYCIKKAALPLITIISLSVLLLSLIPFLITALYSYPFADDFGYGIGPHLAWQDTGSLIRVMSMVWANVAGFYVNWQGSFAAIFLMSLNPAIFNESLYGITTVLLLGMLVISVFYFVQTIFKTFIKANHYIGIYFATVVLFFMIQYMPSVSEGLFWFNSGIYYTFFFCLSLFYYALMIRLLDAETNKEKYVPRLKLYGAWAVLLVLSILIAGGNLVTGLITSCISIFICMVRIILRKQRILPLVIVNIVLLSFFMINCLAPGNAYRALYHESPGVLTSFLVSFRYCIYYIIKWSNWRIALTLLLLQPLFYFAMKPITIRFRLPLLYVAAGFCLLSAQFYPIAYSGSWLPERMANIIYFTYIFWVFSSCLYMTGWLGRITQEGKLNRWLTRFQCFGNKKIKMRVAIVGCAASLFLICAWGSVIRGNRSHTSYIVVDLWNGIPQTYAAENSIRFALYREPSLEVWVEPYTAHPHALYFGDITDDSQHWVNIQVARFFKKNSVRLTYKSN